MMIAIPLKSYSLYLIDLWLTLDWLRSVGADDKIQLTTSYVLRSVAFLLFHYILPDESKYSLCSFRDTSLKKHIFHLGELIPTSQNIIAYA